MLRFFKFELYLYLANQMIIKFHYFNSHPNNNKIFFVNIMNVHGIQRSNIKKVVIPLPDQKISNKYIYFDTLTLQN